MAFLSLFLTASIPAEIAFASCCGSEAATAANTAATNGNVVASIKQFIAENSWLSTIFSTLGSIFSFFQNVLAPAQGANTVATNVNTIVNGTQTNHLGNYLVGSNLNLIGVQGATQNQANATLPDQTTACQWAQEGVAASQMDECTRQLTAANVTLETSVCQGPTANCNGPGSAFERVYDAGMLGLLNNAENPGVAQQYGFPPPQDPTYTNRILNPAYCNATAQMTMPTSVCVLRDGYLAWYGAPPGQTCVQGSGGGYQYNADVSQSSLAWIACYKACENLDNHDQSVGINRPPTTNDFAAIVATWGPRQQTYNVKAACLMNLWRRTAIPAGAQQVIQAIGGSNNVGGTANCAQYQQNECYALTNSPNQNNVDISGAQSGGAGTPDSDQVYVQGGTGVGVGTDNQYANNCANNGTGLSPMMRDRVIAQRHTSTSYLASLANKVHDTSQLETIIDQERIMSKDEREMEDKNYNYQPSFGRSFQSEDQ